jgi:hypothetical protein
VYPQFGYSSANGFHIPEVAKPQTIQPNTYFRSGIDIAETMQPLPEWILPVRRYILPQNLRHGV